MLRWRRRSNLDLVLIINLVSYFPSTIPAGSISLRNKSMSPSYIMGRLREWVPGTPIEMHAHNDYGLATTAMLSAVAGGASVVHTSMNTLGERAENASTEETVIGLELLMGLDTGVKLEKIYPIAALVSAITKIPIPLKQPIIGDNAFTCESGMVVDSIERLSNTDRPFAPFPFAPELIGRRKGYNIVIGKMTGNTAVSKKLEMLGLSATKEQIKEIVNAVKQEASLRKWSLPDEVFESISREVLARK